MAVFVNFPAVIGAVKRRAQINGKIWAEISM